MGIEIFKMQMAEQGWYKFENFVPKDLVEKMLWDLELAYTRCRRIQIENKLENTEGTVHHLVGQGESFLEYLTLFEKLDKYVESYFGGKYILNAFGGNLLKAGMSYASAVHRDIRSFSGELPLMLNTIVFLDDFTSENGATWLMNRGHTLKDKPTDIEFNTSAFQITGKAGDVIFFNSNMWHQAGRNKTNKPRRSLTPMFVRPFVKQQFDYTQFCNDKSSDWMKQILGYNARTPASLNDWYQQPEQRFFRSNQG